MVHRGICNALVGAEIRLVWSPKLNTPVPFNITGSNRIINCDLKELLVRSGELFMDVCIDSDECSSAEVNALKDKPVLSDLLSSRAGRHITDVYGSLGAGIELPF